MIYLGNKTRLSKYIVPILQQCIDDNNIKTYYEPFVGGCNIIDKIRCEKRIGNDIHHELIEMWKAIGGGWKPPAHVSEDEYKYIKAHQDEFPDCLVGYVGFNCSYGAKYFNGYAKGGKRSDGSDRDHPNEAYRNIIKQIPKVKDIIFSCGDYINNEYSNIENAVIYCDPPYEKTTRYCSTKQINYDEFWEWCRKQSKNNFIFISSYDAPDDFECILTKELLANFDSKRQTNREDKIRIEKLFIPKQT